MTEEERKRLLSQINIIPLDDTSNEANQIRARVNQQDQNFFADVGRVFEATGAGISSTLSNLGKGALLVGRDLGVASDFSDKIVNEARNLDTKELEDLAKKANVSTQTLKDYISKTKTSYENINDFSANTFDKWANEANQRVQELQAETDNPFTKEVIGFMPNLSQQAVNVGVSFINPALVPYVAGLEAKGSYYNDAKQRGMTDEQANDFSTAMAGVEAFTEKLTVKDVKAGITKIGEVKSLLKGGIKGATKEATQEAVKETTKSGIKEAFKSLAKGMGENAFQEGVTEIIQEAFADAITKKDLGQSFYDFLNQQDNWKDIWGRVFKSAVGGALSAGITGGVGMGVSSCVSVNNKIQNGEQVTQQEILQANQDAIEKSKTLPKEQQEQFNEQITQGSEIGIQNVINQVETEQNQVPTEPNRAVPMQTSENAQQQVQEQEQQVIPNQNENALKENVEPQNLVESAERSGIDVKDEKTRKNLEVIQKFNENRGIKATFDAEPFKGHDNVNSFFRTDENGNREIVFNPNTMTDKTIQQLAVHEIYHDMVAGGSAQELTDFVISKMSQNKEYQDYVKALQDVYEEQDSDIIKEEAVAHYLEKNLGTNEFISELQQRGDRTTIQRIIDTIKDMITKAKNTLTGKGDLNYLLDLQRKYEQAYNGEFKGSQEQTKLSKQVVENRKALENKFKDITGDTIMQAETKLAGIELRNAQRKNGNLTGELETNPYSKEAMDLFNKYHSSKKSSNYLYHSTSSENLQSILKNGLTIGNKQNQEGVSSKNKLYLATNEELAQSFAPNENITFRINPNANLENLENDLLGGEGTYSITNNIPPNMLQIKENGKWVNLEKSKIAQENTISNQPTTDNQGRELSKGQQEYFRDSKIRDENGELLTVYHGTNSDFTIFDRTKGGQSNTGASVGFWFTETKEGAENFANDVWYGDNKPNAKEVYLNIKKPKIYENVENETQKQAYRQEYENLEKEARDLRKEYSWEKTDYKTTMTFDTLIRDYQTAERTNEKVDLDSFRELAKERGFSNEQISNMERDAKKYTELIKKSKEAGNNYDKLRYSDAYEQFKIDLYEMAGQSAEDANTGGLGMSLNNPKETVEKFRNKLIEDGYDGIVIKNTRYDNSNFAGENNQYVAFYPEQIKNVDNTNPTENVDIRYQQQGTGTSQEIINNFLEKTKVNEGTGTAIKDLARVPIQQETQVKTKTKVAPVPQETTQNNTKNNEILKTARQLLDKQYALQLSDEMANLSETELKSGLQDLYKSQLDEQLYNAIKDDTKSKRTYMKYKDKDTNYVKSVVEDALYSEKPNRNGKLTVKQWLNIANQIGINASDLTTQQIQDLAYGSWFDLKPTKRITQYDNKIHQAVPFEALTADKWVNAIYNKAKDLKIQDFNQLLNEVQEPIKSNITETTEQTRQVAPDSQVTTQDYLTHHPDYYDGDQFDFNAHRTEVINKANQDIVDIIKNSSNLREDLQRAYDLNEKNDVVDIKTGQDEDNRLTYQHKETILSSLLRSKDIENSDLYKLLMEDNTPRQVAPDQAPAQVPQQDVAKERVVEPIRDITDVQRPQVPQGNKVRQSYISMINSDIQTEEAKQISRELMGYDTIVPQTNAFTLAVADRNIEKNGTNETLTTLTTKANNNDSPTAVDIAMGERLIQYYSKTGDRAKLQEAIQTTAMLGTEAGRAVQAMAMISRQTPTGQVTWIQRSVDKVNKRLAKEGKPQFNFTPEMQQKILNSTKENLQKNLDSVYRELGQQVPKSAMEKFNEWRYFSMLANPKTHIRNILGNVVMAQVQRAKNKIAGTIEDFVIGDNAERWNSLKGASKGMYEFAKNDLKNADVQSMLGLNENKYNPQNRLQQNQRTFKNNFLEGTLGKLFDLNSKLLEVEDGWGLKSGYAKAMANYLNANNLDYTNLTDTQLQKARQYAVQQAKEATFHQDNSIANMLQTIENKNLFTKIAVGGAIPFKKTPMNVALTGFEYSPAGFVKTLTTDLSNLKKGKISANQFIDNISKNLTGTGITLVGYALTQAGILKASGSGDEDKDEFEEATGKQNYSIQIGDNTYSLDWLTPAGIPLFIGSELYQVSHKQEDGNKTKNENESLKAVSNILDATASAMNPMSEMTMISSLTSALKSYASGNAKSIENMIANVGKSYVTQAVPTALGQIARSTDEYERSTTSTETDPMTKAIDSAKNQIISKIPGLRETLPVSTDVWGNARETQTYEENAILPWTKKEISQDPVNKALTDLYDATGDGGVLPDNYIDKTLKVDKEKYKLTNEEYAELKKQYGKTAHDILSNLTNTNDYKEMTDEQKVKAVKEAYSYAKSTLKVKYSNDNDLDAEESSTYKKVQSVINNGGDAREYFEYVGLIDGLDEDKERIKALQDSNIKDKGAIYESTVGKKDKTYQIMKNTGIDPDAYLDYKQQEFKTDRENDYSAKNQFYDYMDNADMTYEQKLLLTGMKYKLNPGERDTLANYIESLPISAQEKTDMFSKLKGCKINEYGEIYY